jgi:N-acetylmuramoyl-L-alanine amidase
MFRREFITLIATGIIAPIKSAYSFAQRYVYNVRFWSAPDSTRMVLDVSGKVKYKIFELKKPYRIVIDLNTTKLSTLSKQHLSFTSKHITKIRYGKHKNSVRLVFDNPRRMNYKIFSLKPNSRYKYHRLVVDLTDKNSINKTKIIKSKKPVIIIDPGHGGEDPGAIGVRGSYEKNVVLNISKRLAKEINNDGSFKAILTRRGDYYISLKKRIKIAQQYKAALFISIHADAALRKGARGASIYTLSKKGSNTEFTKYLEQTQNTSDIFGGEPEYVDKDKNLNNYLTELSRQNREKESQKIAKGILSEVAVISRVRKPTKKANFVVLKTPAIPSILVETGFMSNKYDERNLNNRRHQQKIAKALFQGIDKYFTHS